MFGFIAAACAVVGVGCYIFNKLTEREREYQRELRKAHQEYCRNMENLASDYKEKAKEKIRNLYENAVADEGRILKEALQINLDEIIEYYNLIKKAVVERIEEKSKVLKEINSNIEELIKHKDKNGSYLRKNSYNIILNEFVEIKNYYEGYLRYLNEYDKKLEKDFNHSKNLIAKEKFNKFEVAPFEFILPEFYPYNGKLIEVELKDISEDGKFKKDIEGLYFPKDFQIMDIDLLENFVEENTKIPMLVDYFDFENKQWPVYIGRGILVKNLMEKPGFGINATVHSIEKNRIILDYYGVKLKLHFENLINPRVIPLRGTELTVYPMEIKRELKSNFMPRVTEDVKECLLLEYISDIPLILDNEDAKRFEDYIVEKNKQEPLNKNSSFSWKIGLVNEENDSLFKLQLGDNLVILAERKNLYGDFQILKFLDFTEEKFKPEDIFLSINGTFSVKLMSETKQLTIAEIESMNTFLILCDLEFKNQKKIKESLPGSTYFNKWIDVTNKLINHLQKDQKPFYCELTNFNIKREDKFKKIRIWSATLCNFQEIESRLKECFDQRNIEFILVGENETYYDIRFFKDIESESIVEITEKLKDNYISSLQEKGVVECQVYVKGFPYAEIQQKKALNNFLNSKVENNNIKFALLSGKNIEELEESKKIEIKHFFNEALKENPHQKEIVERVLNSKDIFYIQGPPGTGKTTVIKEIILQQLHINPDSNILITSQTNVAVDNVLRGLNEFDKYVDKKELLRCGNEDKIADEIKEYSFDNILFNYREGLKNVSLNNLEETELHEIWNDYIDDKKKLKNELGELLLKSKRIIGATCVGIANRKIGLDDMAFDLVIVDEASKALPAEILIPLNKAKKCVIIGDHKQLPPTINPALTNKDEIELEDREYCVDELFQKSMFERIFEDAPDFSKGMLKTQYRMPTAIGNMISQFFYDSNLENGQPCAAKKSLYFDKNLNWIDTSKCKNNIEIDTESPYNLCEANIVLELIKNIREKNILNRIAVITPYKGQKRKIKTILREKNLLNNVIVDTVDSFQGDEAEIVLFSITRSKKHTKFFNDDARLNVAFSRAKNELIIVGSIDYFKKGSKNESKLSQIAEFIKNYGNIIEYKN